MSHPENIPVTAIRSHGGMTKRSGHLRTINAILNIGDVAIADIEWNHKPARDGRPQMWRGRVHGVEIWLKGVNPKSFDGEIVGLVEVRVKEVTQHAGKQGGRDEASYYLYVNVGPRDDTMKTGHVFIVKPQKKGAGRDRCKRLPSDFDSDCDYVTFRQGQPWQVIQVREAPPTD